MAWWSGLGLLVAFLFAGLAHVTDRSTVPSARLPVSKLRPADKAPYELDSAA